MPEHASNTVGAELGIDAEFESAETSDHGSLVAIVLAKPNTGNGIEPQKVHVLMFGRPLFVSTPEVTALGSFGSSFVPSLV